MGNFRIFSFNSHAYLFCQEENAKDLDTKTAGHLTAGFGENNHQTREDDTDVAPDATAGSATESSSTPSSLSNEEQQNGRSLLKRSRLCK